MNDRSRTVHDEDRRVLLRLALGEGRWQETAESRFVHNTTGETTAIFDARIHGSFNDWHLERRCVIATEWEAEGLLAPRYLYGEPR